MERFKRVVEMYNNGMTFQDIAGKLRVSRQRAHQLYKKGLGDEFTKLKKEKVKKKRKLRDSIRREYEDGEMITYLSKKYNVSTTFVLNSIDNK